MSHLNQPSLSIVLATFNEAENLPQCLQAASSIADEIIVVDGSSTDNTRDIARQFGAKVIKTTNKPIFHINKQMAIDAAQGSWVLQLDADEVVTPQLAQEIKTVISSQPEENAFWVPRQNFFLNRFLTKGGQYPDPVIRLFKKGQAHLPQQDVHEQMSVKGKTGHLTHPLKHYTAPTFSRYLTNANRYTDLTASQLLNRQLPFSLRNTISYLLVKPVTTFALLYFRHKGFVDGYPGFIFALFSGLHHPIAYCKYWELAHQPKTQ